MIERGRGTSKRTIWLAGLCLAAVCAAGARAQDAGGGDDALVSARTLMDAQKWHEAVGLLDARLAASPGDVEALMLRGEAFRKSSRLQEAARDYERLTSLKPGDADGWFWLGTVERWLGMQTEAIAAYGRSVQLAPCYMDALTGRARSRTALGQVEEAERDLRAALACEPKQEEANTLLAENLARRGRMDEAEALVASGSEGAERERRLAALDLAAKRDCRAAEHYRAARAGGAVEPAAANAPAGAGEAALLVNLGAAERGCGHSKAALQAYRDAVAADGTNIEARYWVGVLASREGLTEEALDAFDAILAEQPRNTAALTGKARVLRYEGRPTEAMTLVDQALALDPTNDEARVLKGQLLAGQGREEAARDAYKAVLAHRPADADALASLETVGPERYWSLLGFSDRADVVEGLDEEGLWVAGEKIVPTRIEYIIDGARLDTRLPVTDRSALVLGLSDRREATRNLDDGSGIYDLNVVTGEFGFDHRLADPWTFSWRAGASRYTPRDEDTIDTDVKPLGLASLERAGERSLLRFTLSRMPFIWRGFAGNTQFRIFDHDQALVEWDWRFDRGWRFESSAAANLYDDGNQPTSVAAGFGWEQGDRRVFLRASHDPFPSRFLDENNELDFVDYDSLVLSGSTPLWWGFRFYGEGTLGQFKDGHSLVEALGDYDHDHTADLNYERALINGPFETNNRQALDTTLAWSPPRFRPFTIGAEYVYDRYDFDSAGYNTNDLHGVWAIVEVVDEAPERRVGYTFRYGRGFIGDERDASYGANDLLGRLSLRLGRDSRADGPVRLEFEARWRDNTLADDLYDESVRHARIYLLFPF